MSAKKDSLAVVGLTLLMVVPAIIWGGYALSVLWGWFIVTAFNVPALSVVQAIGVSMVFHLPLSSVAREHTLKKLTEPDESPADRMIGVISHWIAVPLTALAFGWVVKQWL